MTSGLIPGKKDLSTRGFRLETIRSVSDNMIIGRELLAGHPCLPKIVSFPVLSEIYWMVFYRDMRKKVVLALNHIGQTEWVSVNVFTHHLANPFILDSIRNLSNITNSHEKIVLEWVERRGGDMDLAIRTLLTIRDKYGFRIAIDDMGEGEDGLGRISHVRPDFIKLSGKLIHQSRLDRRVLTTLNAISSMSDSLQSEIIAEWVENEIDLQIARDVGARYWQGWLDRTLTD